MKKIIKNIEKVFEKIGIIIRIGKKHPRCNYVLLDKSQWQPFYENAENPRLYEEALKKVNGENSTSIYKELRFANLMECIDNTLERKIKGDFAECGVWKGHSAYIICSYIEKFNNPRNFYLFDSFEGGLSDKSIVDKNERSYICSCSRC